MEYKEDQLTEWFDIEKQKPWEHGVYQVESDFGYCTGHATSYWDGNKWHFTCDTPADAYKNKELPTCDKIVKWRGINFNPNAPKPKKGNKRKTMYVVMLAEYLKDKQPVAAFNEYDTAKKYLDQVVKKEKGNQLYYIVPTKRFRTPEA